MLRMGFPEQVLQFEPKTTIAQISGIENKNDTLHAIWINRQESKNPEITNDSSTLLKLFNF